jgi:hypothetical protein
MKLNQMASSGNNVPQHHGLDSMSQKVSNIAADRSYSSPGKINMGSVSISIPSNKTLGIIAMICSPFLFVEMLSDHKFGLKNTPAAGIADLIYMTGWICSIMGLIRQKATGNKLWGKRLLRLNLIFLGVACIWNVWSALDPGNNSTLYRILDFFWPASNTLLFITGIVIVAQKKLTGYSRFTPVIAGFWLGFAILFSVVAGFESDLSFYTIGAYSAIAWFLLGLSIYRSERTIYYSERA